jgi:hypothetical protein
MRPAKRPRVDPEVERPSTEESPFATTFRRVIGEEKFSSYLAEELARGGFLDKASVIMGLIADENFGDLLIVLSGEIALWKKNTPTSGRKMLLLSSLLRHSRRGAPLPASTICTLLRSVDTFAHLLFIDAQGFWPEIPKELRNVFWWSAARHFARVIPHESKYGATGENHFLVDELFGFVTKKTWKYWTFVGPSGPLGCSGFVWNFVLSWARDRAAYLYYRRPQGVCQPDRPHPENKGAAPTR